MRGENCKPLIAVAPLWDEGRNSIWMLPGYHDILFASGAIPVDIPFGTTREDATQLLELCDGLLLTGGQDVDPNLYGEMPEAGCGQSSKLRDEHDKQLLQTALELDLPVLGICRGIQFINAYFGGTLWQDLPSQRLYGEEHRMKPPYDRAKHSVEVLEGSPLAEVVGSGMMGVNSYHHQAVRMLAPCLEAMAFSEDCLIEALYCPDRAFLWAVQWHPELSWHKDARQLAICEAFVEACRL